MLTESYKGMMEGPPHSLVIVRPAGAVSVPPRPLWSPVVVMPCAPRGLPRRPVREGPPPYRSG